MLKDVGVMKDKERLKNCPRSKRNKIICKLNPIHGLTLNPEQEEKRCEGQHGDHWQIFEYWLGIR